MICKESRLKEKDFSKKEKELVQLHINNYPLIGWNEMHSAWRDEKGRLCIRYTSEELDVWFHYDVETGEWW